MVNGYNSKLASLRNRPLSRSDHPQLQDLHDDEKAEATAAFKDKVGFSTIDSHLHILRKS